MVNSDTRYEPIHTQISKIRNLNPKLLIISINVVQQKAPLYNITIHQYKFLVVQFLSLKNICLLLNSPVNH